MKIFFICDYFPPFAPGGAEWSSYYAAQALAKRQKQVVILTPNYGHPFRVEKKENLKIIRFPFPFKLKNRQATLPYFLQIQPLYYLYSAFWILFYALKEKPDVVHLQDRFSFPGAVFAKWILRKPLVFTLRNFVLFCPTGTCLFNKKIKKEYSQFSHFWKQCAPQYINQYIKPKSKIQYYYSRLSLFCTWVDNLFKRSLLKHCDQLIAISQSLRNIYLKSGLIKKDNIKVVYNLPPIVVKKNTSKEIDKFKRKYNLINKKIVLFAGRLTLGKGVYDLLKAGEIVYQQEKDTLFLLVGKGKLRIKDQPWLRIIQGVSHKNLLQFYQLADLVVVPTRGIEPFGRVPIEAAIFKKPVVVTKSGGLKEQIRDQKTGFIVPRGNYRKLAMVILKVLKDRPLRLKIGNKHHQFVGEHFSQEKITQQTIDIYQSLLT